jgi:ATP-binding cassette subfamily C protein
MARRAGAKQTELLHSLLARLTDSLQSIKPLKAMAREDLADAVLETETHELNRALQKQVFSKEALRALQEPMLTVFLASGLYVALVRWALPPAAVMVLAFLLARLLIQLSKVQQQYQKMVIFESAYWSLQEKIKEADGEQEILAGRRLPTLEQGVRLDRVSFKYGKTCVIDDISLELPAGLFTALTGSSGAGKTTVADLIMGLVKPHRGRIWIDSLPLTEVDIRSWRRMIGYVPQEILLLHDTVMKNVSLGDPALSEQEVESALRLAGAWDFVMTLPQGLNSTVGERGGKLSGGQRQRIVIARALAQEPALLILDEATSGLDPESESSIYRSLRHLRGKLTILAISHQPAVMTAADRTYRLEDGEALLATNDLDINADRESSGAV